MEYKEYNISYNCKECDGYKPFTCSRYKMYDKNTPVCKNIEPLSRLEKVLNEIIETKREA